MSSSLLGQARSDELARLRAEMDRWQAAVEELDELQVRLLALSEHALGQWQRHHELLWRELGAPIPAPVRH